MIEERAIPKILTSAEYQLRCRSAGYPRRAPPHETLIRWHSYSSLGKMYYVLPHLKLCPAARVQMGDFGESSVNHNIGGAPNE